MQEAYSAFLGIHFIGRAQRMQCGWGCGGWLTSHEMRAFYPMPKPTGGLTQGESLGPKEVLEAQAWTSTGA
jgi:hypothetical protein